MKPDEQRMRDVLVDTIRLLCRTGIDYSHRLRVQGLLGITVDDEHVFLIHVDDFITRNCTDVDNSVCGFADECGIASRGNVNPDVVGVSSVEQHNVLQDFRGNCTKQHQLGPVLQHPKRLTLSQSSHNDVLTSVALSEISSVVATSAETRDFPSSHTLSQNTQNLPLLGSIPPPVVSKNCDEAVHFASNGNATMIETHAAEPANVPQSKVPNEAASTDGNELPVLIKMEIDAREENAKNENVVVSPPADNVQSDAMPCTPTPLTIDERRRLSNLDDLDSSSPGSNEDGDSDHSSESDEVLAMPPLDLISSLQYQPQAVVGNASRWPIGGVQRCGSDGGTDPVTIQPAVLTGVVQTGGSHVSAYYQQQVAF